MTDFPAGDELLAIFVQAEAAAGEKRSRFRVQPGRRSGALVRHPGLRAHGNDSQAFMRCNRQDIEDLAAGGFLRLDKQTRSVRQRGSAPRVYSESWEFDVTPEGFRRIEDQRRAAAPALQAMGGSGLDWETDVLPVLRAAYEVGGDGDPDLGISADVVNAKLGRSANDLGTGRVLISLLDTGYIIQTLEGADQAAGPYYFRLGEAALRIVAGWPTPGSGDRFVEQLMQVLEERIAGAQGEERTRLERLRDVVVGVGHDVFVAVVVDAARKLGGDIY
jgi:hypothetical protein